jgi:ABC-type transport system involved in multi-copper enzyme maturation permease subunit
MSTAIIKYILTAALRDKLLLSVVAVAALGICLSLFMASSAVIEQDQFTLVYMGSSLRILGLIGLVLFTIFFIRRLFDSRDIEYLLSRPISRLTLMLSSSAAFSLLAIGSALLLGMIVGGVAASSGHVSGVALWFVGIAAEYVVMVNVALFFAFVLTSPITAGMATLGFYLLARMNGQLMGIIQNSGNSFPGQQLLNNIMNMVSMLMPRLDLMTQTSWLIYGDGGVQDYLFIFVQTGIFLALILTAATIDLVRRQF